MKVVASSFLQFVRPSFIGFKFVRLNFLFPEFIIINIIQHFERQTVLLIEPGVVQIVKIIIYNPIFAGVRIRLPGERQFGARSKIHRNTISMVNAL